MSSTSDPSDPADADERPTEDCGELALQRRALEADGKGERHPTVIAVEEALSACSDSRPSAEACRRVLAEVERNQREYGPRHPAMIVATAKLELCRATYGPDGAPPPAAPSPPSAKDCNALRAERERLIEEGKGERHPKRMVVDARLESCAEP